MMYMLLEDEVMSGFKQIENKMKLIKSCEGTQNICDTFLEDLVSSYEFPAHEL